MKDIENLDLNLKLLSNLPILVHGINVYPVSIKQIAEFGYTKYNQGLKILCISKIEIENLVNEDISPFEFLQMNMLFDSNIKILLCDVLSLICRAKVTYSSKQEEFIIEKETLNKENFDEVIDIIRKRNSLENESEINENPSNEKAKTILKKRQIARNKLMKNNKTNNNLYLYDLASTVDVGLKLPIDKVMEYSIYQLSNQFKRLISKENYDISFNALIHGANKNDLDLNHW